MGSVMCCLNISVLRNESGKALKLRAKPTIHTGVASSMLSMPFEIMSRIFLVLSPTSSASKCRMTSVEGALLFAFSNSRLSGL